MIGQLNEFHQIFTCVNLLNSSISKIDDKCNEESILKMQTHTSFEDEQFCNLFLENSQR
jgi:hypothetical protein